MLRLEGVTKSFGDKRAVDQVSLVVPTGQMVGVIGRSGAGKSTLLRMINRLGDPTAGRILLRRHRRHGAARPAAARLARALRHDLPAVQPRRPARRADQRADGPAQPCRHAARAAQAVERGRPAPSPCRRSSSSTWRGLAAQRADTLSGGQQQRVAIARALVQEPDIILADEPIASLDPRNTKVVMDALLRINKHFGITVICNLHSLDTRARATATGWSAWPQGRVVFDGVPAGAHRRRRARTLRPRSRRGHGHRRHGAAAAGRRTCARRSPSPDTADDRVRSNRPTEYHHDQSTSRHWRFAAGALALAASGPSVAQDWKAKYPEIVLAIVPAENAGGVVDRFTPFVEVPGEGTRHQGDAARRQRLHRGHRGPEEPPDPYRLLRPGFLRPRLCGLRRQHRRLRHHPEPGRLDRLLLGRLREGRQPLQDDRRPQGQEARPGRCRTRRPATRCRASS